VKRFRLKSVAALERSGALKDAPGGSLGIASAMLWPNRAQPAGRKSAKRIGALRGAPLWEYGSQYLSRTGRIHLAPAIFIRSRDFRNPYDVFRSGTCVYRVHSLPPCSGRAYDNMASFP